MGTGGNEEKRVKKDKKKRKSPLYENVYDAIARLNKNGMKVTTDGDFIIVHGEPGIKLLGAVDYLKKTGATVKVVSKKERG